MDYVHYLFPFCFWISLLVLCMNVEPLIEFSLIFGITMDLLSLLYHFLLIGFTEEHLDSCFFLAPL